MLIGLGFKPLTAAGLAIRLETRRWRWHLADWASQSKVLEETTKLALNDLKTPMIGKQLALFGLIIPFWLVCAMSGWRKTLEVWPACLTAGLTFAGVQLLVSNFHGPSLVAIGASLASILSLLLLLRFWQPKKVWRLRSRRNGRPPRGRRKVTRSLTENPSAVESATERAARSFGRSHCRDSAAPATSTPADADRVDALGIDVRADLHLGTADGEGVFRQTFTAGLSRFLTCIRACIQVEAGEESEQPGRPRPDGPKKRSSN